MRGSKVLVLLVVASATLALELAVAQSQPGPKRGSGKFRLFARSEDVLAINRVRCNLRSNGEICTPTADFPGGVWPKGTVNQYVFNSGFQVAGIVGGTKADNPWAGDTTAALFFDPRFSDVHAEQVRPISNSANPADLANWPAAALVPSGDANEAFFDPVLRGTPSASQGDAWWLTWDGNPSLSGRNGGTPRPHPLGVLLEQRAMAWNAPAGNEDIIYFIFTLYNITSTRPADYAGARPAMQGILLDKARDFQALNNAAFGITLPERGYPITDIFLAFAADMDVGNGFNYASVNVPFAMGYTYMPDFPSTPIPTGQLAFRPLDLLAALLCRRRLCRGEIPQQSPRLAGSASRTDPVRELYESRLSRR